MFATLRPFLLLAAILWAVLRTNQSPRYLRLYLIAEFATTLAIEMAGVGGTDSTLYAVVYCIARPVEIFAAFLLGNEKRKGAWFAVAVTLMATAAPGIHHGMSVYAWIAAVEGFGFLAVGASLSLSPNYHADKFTGLMLACLWMLLGLFDLGYAMNVGNPSWQLLNTWWPTMACVLAFAAVGVFRAPLKVMRLHLPRVPEKAPLEAVIK